MPTDCAERTARPTPDGSAAPHEITLAVWEMPEAVAAGERFAVKVGAKSSAGCVLRGGRIEVRDAAGAVVASGCLGDAPWPGTERAVLDRGRRCRRRPRRDRSRSRRNSTPAELDPPHRGAASPFSVAVVERPEHTLTVKVIAKDDRVPIEDAQIRLGPYRATTDASGRAEVRIAKGRYAAARSGRPATTRR